MADREMKRKPRLTVAEARMFCEVDAYLARYWRDVTGLHEAFSDVHDGGLYRNEVDGLIRKRLLRVVPIDEPPGPREWDRGLMGYSWTVDMTDRAIEIFWPKLQAKRHVALAKAEPQP